MGLPRSYTRGILISMSCTSLWYYDTSNIPPKFIIFTPASIKLLALYIYIITTPLFETSVCSYVNMGTIIKPFTHHTYGCTSYSRVRINIVQQPILHVNNTTVYMAAKFLTTNMTFNFIALVFSHRLGLCNNNAHAIIVIMKF